jgi:hypothetical protein
MSGLSSIASSSGRFRRSTVPTRSIATLRADGEVAMLAQMYWRGRRRTEVQSAGSKRALAAIVPHSVAPPYGTDYRSAALRNDAVIHHRSSRLGGSRGPHHLHGMSTANPISNNSAATSSAAAATDGGATPPAKPAPAPAAEPMPREIGGPKGPEPTRYGDWERNGRCTDF